MLCGRHTDVSALHFKNVLQTFIVSDTVFVSEIVGVVDVYH